MRLAVSKGKFNFSKVETFLLFWIHEGTLIQHTQVNKKRKVTNCRRFQPTRKNCFMKKICPTQTVILFFDSANL